MIDAPNDQPSDQARDQAPQPLHADRLTWAVMLGRWTDFARSAVALPEDGEGGLVRESVTDIITLQSVWFALSHLDELDPEQQQLGLNRAGVLIARHTAAIRSRFFEHPLPEGLVDLINDVESIYSSLQAK